MKKLFLKTLAIGLILLAMPLRQFGQEVKNHIIELELENIENPDMRFCLLSNIANDAHYIYAIDEENNSVLLYSADHWSDDHFQSYFSQMKSEVSSEFDNYLVAEKEIQGSTFSSWKESLPQDLFVLLFRLMLIENPNSRDNNQTCATSEPFCTSDIVTFHVDANPSGYCESGPEYGCLSSFTDRRPYWFHMKIGVAGAFQIRMTNSAGVDIDYCCWGPFDDPVTPCPDQLQTIVGCGSTTSSIETCNIPSNSQVGKYYIMVITKWNQSTQTDITFKKVDGSGPGETDCSIVPLINSGSPYCVGETINLTCSAQGAGATYHWTGPHGFTSNSQNPTVTTNCSISQHAGTYTCTVSKDGQTESVDLEVVIYASVSNANITATPTSACQGSPIQFSGSATTNPSSGQNVRYNWDFGDGQTADGAQNVSHTYAQPGTYQVTLTASSGGHCTAQKTKSITVYATPEAEAGEDQTVNYGTTVQLQGTGGNGNFSYHWEPANMVSNPNIANPQTTPLTASQVFVLTVSNPSHPECNSSDQVRIDVSGTAMTASGNAAPAVICAGSSTQLTVNAENGTGQYTYAWAPTTGLSNAATHNPIASPTQTTTYTCTVSDGMTSHNIPITVTVHDNPVANAGDNQTIRYGAVAQLEGSGGTGTFNYHWEPANMVINPNAQNTTSVGLTAETTFTLTVTNQEGDCVDTDEMTVYIEGSDMTINPNATPSAICEGESTSQLNAHAGGGTGNFTYTWSPETGLDDPHSATPIASPTQTTTYTCTVSDGYSSANRTVTVTVYHPEQTEETRYICANETLIWHDQPYSAEGNYDFDTITDNGCRKTITLHLHHYPIYDETIITEAICPGETYDFFGTPYNHSCNPANTMHTLQTIHGCDSIVRLDLTVYEENGVTEAPVTVCPEQLPYEFYGEYYDKPIEVIHTDHDIHGCDSLVKLILNVDNYYIPDTERHYIAYDDEPSFTWSVNHQTYNENGHYIDTLPTETCEGIFTLDLEFMKVPDPIITIDTACDTYTWTVLGTPHHYAIQQDAYGQQVTDIVRDNLAPFHYEDGRAAYQDYQLQLQLYKTSNHEGDFVVDGECDTYTWQLGTYGEPETFTTNGSWTKTFKSQFSNYHCDSIVTLTIQNMKYSPNPYDTIFPNETSTIMSSHYDTAYVITNTEFFSFIYDFYVREKGSSKWDGCIWEKSEWADWEIVPYIPTGETVAKNCKVYVGQRYDRPVELTCKMWNDCMDGDTLVRKLFLKSSFLGVDEQPQVGQGNVEIFPNPNSGLMRLDFENMEGRVNVKIYDMTGRLVDGIETKNLTHNQSIEYQMKDHEAGIYYFIISNDHQLITRKVVLLR